MLCDTCRHAGSVYYPDGDMFVCAMDSDPRVPFDMDEDTDCPCYEPIEEDDE